MQKNESARLLAIPDAARYLGTTIWNIRQLIWSKRLPGIRLGKRWLLDRNDLDAFVERMKKEEAA